MQVEPEPMEIKNNFPIITNSRINQTKLLQDRRCKTDFINGKFCELQDGFLHANQQ